jgi:hypothetical protein
MSIEHPMVYRLRHGRWRGATWVNEDAGIVWLLGAAQREEDSPDDAFEVFEGLHGDGRLLPNEEDHLRDRVEGAARLVGAIEENVPPVLTAARSRPGQETRAAVAAGLSVCVFVRGSEGVEEVWVAVPVRDEHGAQVPERVRNVVFAAFELACGGQACETRYDWPTRKLQQYEVVRLYLREV